MSNTYVFTGKDGKTRQFNGPVPPTPKQLADIEAADNYVPDSPHLHPIASDAHPLSDGPDEPPSTIDKLNAMLGPMAHPQTSGDFAGLLVPSELGMGRGGAALLKEAAQRYGSAFKAAAQDTPAGIRGIASYPLRAFGKLSDAMPSSNTKAVDDFFGGPRTAATAPPPRVMSSAPDVVDRNLRPQTPSTALSDADRALLLRQNYDPSLIEKIAAQRSAPTGGGVQPMSDAEYSARATAGHPRGQWPAPAPEPARPPMSVSPSSPMQPPAPSAPLAPRAVEGQPVPIYGSAGSVKGVTSNALETASNAALAAGHYDEAERLIGQSLQSFFQGSGGPMVGVLAAAIAHKARQIIEPLRADPAFQRSAPAKQQQMIQQALRQPGARGSLTGLLDR